MAMRNIGLQELAVFLGAALCCAALILVVRPLFVRYALARPNARSSHTKPTPQGGGVAVILAAMLALGTIGAFAAQERAILVELLPLGAAVVILTVMGAVDDMLAIAVLPRFALQAVAVALVVATLPAELRAVPMLLLAGASAAG